MNTNRAQDQAPATGRATTALQKQSTEVDSAPAPTKTQRDRVVPLAGANRRWRVRIHWGIAFAVAASLVLWLAIKSVIGLLF